MPLTAVVYVPREDLVESTVTCLDHVQASGYHLEGIVVGRWDVVQQMLDDGLIQVVVVAEDWHPPPNRVPRIEVARRRPPPPKDGEDDEGPPTPPGHRRPKPIG